MGRHGTAERPAVAQGTRSLARIKATSKGDRPVR